ncbi:MAG: hypothetical protein ACWA6U_16660 [Breznakibacter sp.]
MDEFFVKVVFLAANKQIDELGVFTVRNQEELEQLKEKCKVYLAGLVSTMKLQGMDLSIKFFKSDNINHQNEEIMEMKFQNVKYREEVEFLGTIEDDPKSGYSSSKK